MNSVVIIPARYHSTRFPGKPLVNIGNKTMIRRVYEQASKAVGITQVIVATDDNRIYDEVKSFGGNVCLTSTKHLSGTDRCAEVLGALSFTADAVINVQGDEPFINPEQIEQVHQLLLKPDVQIATLAQKITDSNYLNDHAKVKVVFDKLMKAIYFSRFPIPYNRNPHDQNWLNDTNYYHHIGIYGYQSKVLNTITKLAPTHLEKAESLEQLRWIENGFTIHVGITIHESFGIDTKEDLEKVKTKFLN